MDYKQRITHCGAAAAALLLSHMTPLTAANTPLITNAGFDNDFTGWQWQPADAATATAQVLKQAVLDGSNVLELTRSAPADATTTVAPSVVYQSVNLEPGKDYRLSVWALSLIHI